MRCRSLSIRQADDDPNLAIVGRTSTGEFVEVPAVAVDAIRLIDHGLSIAAAELELALDQSTEFDLVEFARAMLSLGFVAELDGRTVSDNVPVRRGHLDRLRARHVKWIFGRPAKLALCVLCLISALELWRNPEILPRPADFYWSSYVGVTTLVNTSMLALSIMFHEVMHLLAARSLEIPARISFGTRLHNLVAQTDVSGAWSVRRRWRYRIYLAGMCGDLAVIGILIIAVQYARLLQRVENLFQAWMLLILLSIVGQAQFFMRTDLYYVLLDILRCRNLFEDGLAYVGYIVSRVRFGNVASVDPSVSLPTRERRAVRLYAIAVVGGSGLALAVFGLVVIPIVLAGLSGAIIAVSAIGRGGSMSAGLDGAALLLTEASLLVAFLIAFHRGHPGWVAVIGKLHQRPRRNSSR